MALPYVSVSQHNASLLSHYHSRRVTFQPPAPCARTLASRPQRDPPYGNDHPPASDLASLAFPLFFPPQRRSLVNSDGRKQHRGEFSELGIPIRRPILKMSTICHATLQLRGKQANRQIPLSNKLNPHFNPAWMNPPPSKRSQCGQGCFWEKELVVFNSSTDG